MSWNSPAALNSRPGKVRTLTFVPSNPTLESSGRWGASPTRDLASSMRGFSHASGYSTGTASRPQSSLLGLTPPPTATWHRNNASVAAHPAAGVFRPDHPASNTFLAEGRTPERRAAWANARASLPAAGLVRGFDVNSRHASTWLAAQKHGEPHRAFVG
jgi:hypothetical protein